MNKYDYVCIQIKDICYYDDDFEYEPIIVKKGEDFEEKYAELEKLCKNYESFDEVDEFIDTNFERIIYEERYLRV